MVSLIAKLRWLAGDKVRAICVFLGLLQVYVAFFPDALLIVWPDSIGYLGPAVDMLERGYFSHWYARGFVYPLFLLGVLGFSPEPAAIVLAQRLLVIVTYVALACSVWLLARHAIRRQLTKPWIVEVAAFFWLLAYVLYPPVLGMAHAVMAETLFSCFVAMVVLGGLVVCLPEMGERWRMVAAILAIFMSFALVLVKPHWLLPGLMLPALLPLVAPSGQGRLVAAGVGVGMLLSGLLLFLPEKMLQQKYDAYPSQVFGPRTLFCNSADLIQPYLNTQEGDGFSRQVAKNLEEFLRPEARVAATSWKILQFDGDKCMYGETARIVSAHFAGLPREETTYYLTTYAKALLAQPGYLPQRLTRQFGALASSLYGEMAGSYVTNARTVAANRQVRQLFDDWLVSHKWQLVGFIELPLGNYLCELKTYYGLAGLSILLMSFVALCRAVGWRAKRTSFLPLEMAFFMILSCTLAMNLLIASVHTFDIARYSSMQAPLFSIIGFLSLLLALRSTASKGEILGTEEIE